MNTGLMQISTEEVSEHRKKLGFLQTSTEEVSEHWKKLGFLQSDVKSDLLYAGLSASTGTADVTKTNTVNPISHSITTNNGITSTNSVSGVDGGEGRQSRYFGGGSLALRHLLHALQQQWKQQQWKLQQSRYPCMENSSGNGSGRDKAFPSLLDDDFPLAHISASLSLFLAAVFGLFSNQVDSSCNSMRGSSVEPPSVSITMSTDSWIDLGQKDTMDSQACDDDDHVGKNILADLQAVRADLMLIEDSDICLLDERSFDCSLHWVLLVHAHWIWITTCAHREEKADNQRKWAGTTPGDDDDGIDDNAQLVKYVLIRVGNMLQRILSCQSGEYPKSTIEFQFKCLEEAKAQDEKAASLMDYFARMNRI